jgi:hypothetical protein
VWQSCQLLGPVPLVVWPMLCQSMLCVVVVYAHSTEHLYAACIPVLQQQLLLLLWVAGWLCIDMAQQPQLL